MLDGLTATITVAATTPEGVVEEQVDVTIWAVPSPSWELCTYEYYDALPPLQIALPIPQGGAFSSVGSPALPASPRDR